MRSCYLAVANLQQSERWICQPVWPQDRGYRHQYAGECQSIELDSISHKVSNHPNPPKEMLKRHRTPRLEEVPKEILYQIIRNLNPYDLECLSEASRRLTILIGLVPCRDAFTWAVHRCQIHRHTRDASLCGDCVHAFDKRIEWVSLSPFIECEHLSGSGTVFARESTYIDRLGIDGVGPSSNIQHGFQD